MDFFRGDLANISLKAKSLLVERSYTCREHPSKLHPNTCVTNQLKIRRHWLHHRNDQKIVNRLTRPNVVMASTNVKGCHRLLHPGQLLVQQQQCKVATLLCWSNYRRKHSAQARKNYRLESMHAFRYRVTADNQCFLFSQIIGYITPKIIYFYYLKYIFWIKVSRKNFILFWKRQHCW